MTLESALTARIARWRIADDERLLAALKTQLPLSENRDLFQFAFKDGAFFVRIEYLLADLLEQGNLEVINLHLVGTSANPFVQKIVIVGGGGGRTPERREFCAPSGELLHGVTDSIS